MQQHRYLYGFLLGFLAFTIFTVSDAFIKSLSGTIPPYETVFFGAICALTTLPFLRGDRPWRDIFKTCNRPLWLVRFCTMSFSTIGSVLAFTHLPMAEALALIFLQPVYVTLMSMLFLGEKIRLPRWIAVGIGFIGVLVVLRPGFRELSIGHLGAILSGLGGALTVIILRAVGNKEGRLSLFGARVLGGIVICGLVMIPHFVIPNAAQAFRLAGYGLLSALGNILMVYAARRAPAAVIGPTQYCQMIWALIIGAVVFDDHLDFPTYIGIGLILVSGTIAVVRAVRHTGPKDTPAEDHTAVRDAA